MHPMMRLSVRRYGTEFVDEPIAVAHISRISPATPGERGEFGCRVSLSTQPVTLMVRQSADEVMDLMVRAQVDLAMAMVPTYTAELVSDAGSTENADDTYRRGMQRMRDLLNPHLTHLRDTLRDCESDPKHAICSVEDKYATVRRAVSMLLSEAGGDGRTGFSTIGRRYVFDDVDVWTHAARGSKYAMIGMARVQAATTINEGDKVVVYVSLDAMAADGNNLWVRPHAEFLDGRFKKVEG